MAHIQSLGSSPGKQLESSVTIIFNTENRMGEIM
jgi:hypothetical protein